MPTYRLDLAYDGSGFHGYARQPEVRTVQGDLEAALFRLTGPVTTSVAGRTDAGVHARGQVVSFRSEEALELDRTHRALVGMLAPEIVVWRVTEATEDFDARLSARSRTYVYSVLNRPLPDPFLRHTTWHVPHPLSLEAMQRAASAFLGEHDFASFCRAGGPTLREVLESGWSRAEEHRLRFRVRARSFCHQMVRSLVALCVEVGRGKVDSEDVPGIVQARDRQAARGAAPPHGLTLWEVEY